MKLQMVDLSGQFKKIEKEVDLTIKEVFEIWDKEELSYNNLLKEELKRFYRRAGYEYTAKDATDRAALKELEEQTSGGPKDKTITVNGVTLKAATSEELLTRNKDIITIDIDFKTYI